VCKDKGASYIGVTQDKGGDSVLLQEEGSSWGSRTGGKKISFAIILRLEKGKGFIYVIFALAMVVEEKDTKEADPFLGE